MTTRILTGHVMDKLAELPDESVHCCVTSPPYFGLRSYGTETQVWGGDSECEHIWGEPISPRPHSGGDAAASTLTTTTPFAAGARQHHDGKASAFCRHCNAWRGDLGLEPSPELYIAHMVEVFREVRRVLRKDGMLWLNIGDSYASGGGHTGQGASSQRKGRANVVEQNRGTTKPPDGYKPKDLLGIPWMLAFALRADGWWLRSEIIWAKKAPMPESVTDRPTSAHEKVFLLTKSPRYFYDAEAVKEAAAASTIAGHSSAGINPRGGSWKSDQVGNGAGLMNGPNRPGLNGSNMRNWWEIDTIDNGQSLQTRKAVRRVRTDPPQVGLFSEEKRDDGSAVPSVQRSEGASGPIGETDRVSDRSEGLSRLSLGRGGAREILGVPEGQSGASQAQSDAPSAQAANRDDINEPGVGDHKGTRGASLPLLQTENGAADDGSRNADQQGRSSRGGEHRSGLSPVQLQEAQQSNKSSLTDFWKLGPEPFPEAHFATFPTEIPRICIKAGTSERGVCPKCGTPWERVTKTINATRRGVGSGSAAARISGGLAVLCATHAGAAEAETIGWRATCSCDAGAPAPATVLDPFLGAGTTALVADQLGRNCIGIELNTEYAQMAERRLRDDAGMFAQVGE